MKNNTQNINVVINGRQVPAGTGRQQCPCHLYECGLILE